MNAPNHPHAVHICFFQHLNCTDQPGVCARGYDIEENAKAALFELTQLNGSKPTLAFCITDAGYHRTNDESPTARQEQSYLEEKGVSETDFFRLFDLVRF